MLDRSRGKNRDRELSDIEDSSQRIEPYQPHPKCIPTQVLSNRVLYFQERWYKEFPWLHCVALQKGVLCFHCRKVYQEKPSPFAAKAEPAFINTGFKN